VEGVELGLTCGSILSFDGKAWEETWQATDCWLPWLKFQLDPFRMT